MKTFFGIMMFIVIGLLTAVGFGFSWQWGKGPLVTDDEQIGLAQQTIIRFSFVVAENTPKGLAAQKFAQLVKAKTNDTIKIELFPNGTLYNETDEVGALQSGSIQMIAPSFSNISQVVPDWMAMDLPFVFQNEEDVTKAFQGKIGNILMRKLEPKGIVGLGFWANGFQQMTSNRGTLAHPEDFRDLKFRILPSKIIESQFRQLNAKTVPVPFNLVYRSMESGQVDGGENTISNIYSKKLYQVQKYLTISNHAYLGYGVLVNKVFWEKLSAEQQRTINEAMQEATVWANQNAIEINRKQWNELQRIGQMNVHLLTNEERDEWQHVLEPVYGEAGSYISKELMAAVNELRRESTNKQSGLD
ncbi:DctP family TRAP transporter solute-binding subunit [Paenibacillus sp. LjRoot153]|uniref:DctP family TRAP transporter solute-binding subunit n=1 Tax=Paenibacillus sp. LjRoot153 TaxID=3342270 RepID=UPI003ED14FEC